VVDYMPEPCKLWLFGNWCRSKQAASANDS